ncbi:MAG: cell envelope integrity protein CreD, partial [Candidatus Accumulibacter sp.]|nr:cell envelope integrity protein CreD [Accumulibacter sp.]
MLILVFIVLLLLFCFALFGLFAFVRFWRRRNASADESASENPVSEESPSGAGIPRLLPPAFPPIEETTTKVFGSIPLHCLIVVLLTLGLLVPLAFVDDLVEERSSMHRSAIRDISEHWGETQSIRGPVLVIPFIRKHISYTEAKNGKRIVNEIMEREYRILLPTAVNFEANLEPQKRARGIYEYVVYTSKIAV